MCMSVPITFEYVRVCVSVYVCVCHGMYVMCVWCVCVSFVCL